MPRSSRAGQDAKRWRGNTGSSAMAAREAEASLPPPSRPAYHIAHAGKRAPSYLFAFIHLCYLHTLVVAVYRYIIKPCLEQRSYPDVKALYTHVRGMTTDLIIKTLLPPQETKRWWRIVPRRSSSAAIDEEKNKYVKGQIIVRQLWSSPATMFFLFGMAYFAVNTVITLLRLLYCTLRHIYRVYCGRSREPVVSVYTLCRYGNGYDSIVRLFFSMIELVWFVRFVHHYYDDGGSGYTYQQMSDGVGSGAGSKGVGAAPSIPIPKSIAPPPSAGGGGHGGARSVSSMLPLPSFAAGDLFSASFMKDALVLGIQLILALTAVLDVQRLFHALVGVRPLSVPNGWECCPLCGQNWKITRHTANRVHVCPQLWEVPGAPPSVTPEVSLRRPSTQALHPESNSDDDEGAVLSPGVGKTTNLLSPALGVTPSQVLGRRLRRRIPRPGDGFPDPNQASLWSRLTYTWLNPLLNVSLLSPFGTFSSPPADAFPDGGDALWRAQLVVVSRLPTLQYDWRTTEAIGDPAWMLWKTRKRTAAEEAVIQGRRGPIERGFLHLTNPIRRVLEKAFILYFLPPTPASASIPLATAAAQAKEPAPPRPGFVRKLCKRWRPQPLSPSGSRPKSPSTEAGKSDNPLTEESDSPTKLRRPSRVFPLLSFHVGSKASPRNPANVRRCNSSSSGSSSAKVVKKSLFKLFLEHPCGREYVYRCVPYKLIEDGLSILAPHVVRALVTFLREVGMVVATSPPRKQTGRERYLPSPGEKFLGRGLFICALLILVIFFQVVFFQAYLNHVYAVAMKATSALKTMLLRRALETPLALAAPKEQHQRPGDSDEDDDDDENDDVVSGVEDDEEQGENGSPGVVGDKDYMNLAASTRLLARPSASLAEAGFDNDNGNDDGSQGPLTPVERGSADTCTNGVSPSDNKATNKSNFSVTDTSNNSKRNGLGRAEGARVSLAGPGSVGKASAPTAATPQTSSPFSGESEVVTLFTVDAGNCGDCLIFLHNVWGHPLIILSSLLSMYSYVGLISTLVTFAVLVAMIPLNKMSATRVRVAQQQSKDSGTRMGYLNAVLSSMRTVKALALEGFMGRSIESARANESDGREHVVRAESVAAGQTELASLFITLACFGTYLLTGGKMDAAVMVPTMAALNVMRFPLWTLPQIFSQVTRGYTSLKRIERYLEGSGSLPTSAAAARSPNSFGDSDDTLSFGSVSAPLAASYASSSPDSTDDLCLPAAMEAAKPGTISCKLCSFAWSRQAVVKANLEQKPLHQRRLTLASPNNEGSSMGVSSSLSVERPSEARDRACVLNNISLHINPGEFVVIQGATGSGKTALLMAMLGELYPVAPSRGPVRSSSRLRLPGGSGVKTGAGFSSQLPSTRSDSVSSISPGSPSFAPSERGCRRPRGFKLHGRVAYCAEIPWLRNQTIRENIRLIPDSAEDGEAVETQEDQIWYQRVLEACALTSDLAGMALGDRTIVGEGGSKLSGGQRARVALARAVYRRDAADIFLLDDILSALDVEVQKHLIAEVVLGLLRQDDDGDDPSSGKSGSNSSSASRRKGKAEDATGDSDLCDLEWRPGPKRTKKTIVLATHIAAEMLMPDRVFDVHADGTLHEIVARRKPTQEHINLQKEVWRMSAAAAKGSNARPTTADANATPQPGPTRAEKAPAAAGNQGGETSPTAQQSDPVTTALSPKRFSLLPDVDDLKKLFIDYMGPRRALTVLLLTILAQALQTFMDNWLGIWMSVHREEEDESLRARLIRLATMPIAIIKGSPTADNSADSNTFSFLIRALWRGGGAYAEDSGDGTGKPWYSLVFDTLYHYFVASQDAVVLQFLFSYALIGLTAASFSFLRTRHFFLSYQHIADTLQLRAVRRLLRAPVSFFDRVPTSSLIHVLSRDQEVVDYSLGESTQLILFTVFQLVAMVCFDAAQHSAFLVVVPLSALLFYHLTLRFLLLAKQVRTLESKLHGRSVTIIKESVRGAVTLRAYGPHMAAEMEQELAEALDAIHTAGSAGLAADRWVALRLECVSIVMTATLALLSVVAVCFSERNAKQKKVNVAAVAAAAAYAGLGINSSLSTARSLSLLCRRIGLFQNQYVSADALLHLEKDTPQEKETMLERRKTSKTDNDDRRKSRSSCPPAPSRSGSESSDSSLSLTTPCFGGSEEGSTTTPLLMDVRHLSARYQPHLPWVLKDVTFKVHAGECVGLIGRTGHGKSSIFNALLQLMDVVKGYMYVNLSGIEEGAPKGTKQQPNTVVMKQALRLSPVGLRKKFFELVPQEPLLVQGTVRSNLMLGLDDTDPTAPETNEKLWEVLQKVSLDEVLLVPDADSQDTVPKDADDESTEEEAATPPPRRRDTPATTEEVAKALAFPISTGGSNLSAGQRQLLCLARALLHQPQIVLLDEVSSRVDKKTDLLIQRIINEELLRRRGPQGSPTNQISANSSAVLMIAHRLETIMSLCDRVLVIERGRCVANLTANEVKTLEDLESYL